MTDGQLLERFAAAQGEAAELAFEVLVERHGPMVLRVCRGVLADSHEAQDAFQATFLVLVGKARTLWVRDSIGPWLHQVAYRTAACARSAAARRRRHEQAAAERTKESQVETQDELGPVLHEEIARLPDRFRAPLVLCDLEGGTYEQAARHLGWPVGIVKSRLSRGRDRLRDRLLRRGIAPCAWPLAPGLRLDDAKALVSPTLVQSTIRGISQFVTSRTVLRESAAILTLEVLRTMTIIRSLKTAAVLLALAATTSGVDLLAQKEAPVVPTGDTDALSTYEIKRGPLKSTFVTRGVIEATRNPSLINQVAGRTTIASIVPERTKVKKGDLVCELDSTALKDQLTNQQIVVQESEMAAQKAKLERELAEITLNEYAQGTYVQERAALQGAIAIGQSSLEMAEARLERTRRARQRLNDMIASKPETKTSADLLAEVDLDDRIDASEQTLVREKKGIELAKIKHDVLEKYRRNKTIHLLKLDIETARGAEFAKRQTLDRERKKGANLEDQIRFCKLYAPNDGLVLYANAPGGIAGQPTIKQGATVRERQIIVTVSDLEGPFWLHTKAKESYVDQLRLGLRAQIKVDAFPDEVMTGAVESISPLPAPHTSLQRSNDKLYGTNVRIENRLSDLRLGMTASAEILVHDLDDVLSVPLQAVRHDDGKDYVAVKKPDGNVDWREVTLGASDGKRIEVKRGLESGERVVDRPLDLKIKKPIPLP
ncbi:sigma-70 family RNA polymerase sigma factor [Singulisphaera acidiphila]|uniref:sigma-70 family RNA polymerase sigma factor n=1 Tax=Singulisphaera acidiphila TaxID=466153 RepID=UPI00030648A7|nr:sigma-70 family RNA polymerase sigma factor [Singulisphaera acidiphila]